MIAEGEVDQLTAQRRIETSEEHYLEIIGAKTAALFAAACRIAAVVAERERGGRSGARRYGRNLGIAFQLVDDAIDYASDAATMGKGVGDDFRDGKVTLPVILAYARGSDDERAFWRDAMAGRARRRRGSRPRDAPAPRRPARSTTRSSAPAITASARSTRSAPSPPAARKAALVEAVEFAIAQGLLSAATADLPDRRPVLPRPARRVSATGSRRMPCSSRPPGAGKTTAVAPALLGEPWCGGEILLLSPRRLAARAAAERMAELAGEPVGGTIGYATRLDSKRSARDADHWS